MPLIDARIKPGQWRVERTGTSGARYRLSFDCGRFFALSRREEYRPMPGAPLYWRRIFTSYTNAEVPHGKLTLEAFADLGFTSKLTVAGFIAGRHIRVTTGLDEEAPRQ